MSEIFICVECRNYCKHAYYEVVLQTRLINIRKPTKSDIEFSKSKGIMCPTCLHRKMKPIDRGIKKEFPYTGMDKKK